MDMQHLVETIDYCGRKQLVIGDASLLRWATESGITPLKAQVEALRRGIVPRRYLKNFRSLGFAEQIKLCSSRVFICGCGGLGGILIELLVRAGVGRVCLMDMDVFAESNLNRQLLCGTAQIGRPKVEVAAERIGALNPLVEVKCFRETLRPENAEDRINGSDLVMDALDDIESRNTLALSARKLRVPFIHAGVAGWWGQIGTFLPGTEHDLSSIYGNRRKRDVIEEECGILGPLPALIGSLGALEAIRILTGKEAAYSGKLLYFDGEAGVFQMIPL